ncbi:MAG: hypothetical protein GX823_00405, partial [Clostridiales bacterium]|nr:hypothetical protein [Clostridiales bacterium]
NALLDALDLLTLAANTTVMAADTDFTVADTSGIGAEGEVEDYLNGLLVAAGINTAADDPVGVYAHFDSEGADTMTYRVKVEQTLSEGVYWDYYFFTVTDLTIT